MKGGGVRQQNKAPRRPIFLLAPTPSDTMHTHMCVQCPPSSLSSRHNARPPTPPLPGKKANAALFFSGRPYSPSRNSRHVKKKKPPRRHHTPTFHHRTARGAAIPAAPPSVPIAPTSALKFGEAPALPPFSAPSSPSSPSLRTPALSSPFHATPVHEPRLLRARALRSCRWSPSSAR